MSEIVVPSKTVVWEGLHATYKIKLFGRVRLKPKIWQKFKNMPDGWTKRALPGYRGVVLVCFDVTKLGNLTPEWLEDFKAFLLLMTETY